MKTFEITLSVHSRLTLEIEASDEQSARKKAAAQIERGEHYLCEDRLRDISVDEINEIG